jgi:hypothetical protein
LSYSLLFVRNDSTIPVLFKKHWKTSCIFCFTK